jgi:hypothetical protein
MIHVELRPESEARLTAAAHAKGLPVEEYAREVLEIAAAQATPFTESQSLGEFQASLDALTRFSEKIPALPIEAFSRESLYEDHN